MKSGILVLVTVLLVLSTSGFAQEKSKKQLKEERKIEAQKQTEVLMNSKVFVFVGRTAQPSSTRTIDLTTNTNYVKFSPELIESSMPFFGQAYSGIGYGGDQGLKFEGKPEKFIIKKGKKNYQIDAEVKGTNDRYKLSLSISFGGGLASLTIISNNRSPISYIGELSAPEKPKEKK